MTTFIWNITLEILKNFFFKKKFYLFLKYRKIYVFIFVCNNIKGQMFNQNHM